MEKISRKLTEGWKMLLGILLFCFVMAISPAYAQNTTVKGVVRDAMGPTAGATVVQKGTNNGTITESPTLMVISRSTCLPMPSSSSAS